MPKLGEVPINRPPELAAAPVTALPPTIPMRAMEIRRADLPKLLEIRQNLGELKPYWCGAMPGGPFQQYNFGGREFVAHQEDVQPGDDGVTQRFRRAGKIHMLADAQVAAILKNIAGKVMRGHGTGSKIQPVAHADYSPHDADHPAGEYVYLVAVSPEFQPPAYEKGKVPRGAVPVVRPVHEEAVA